MDLPSRRPEPARRSRLRPDLTRDTPLAVQAEPAPPPPYFRHHAALLQAARATPGQGSIALDGKTLRGSFDNFRDPAAAQVLSAFATDTALVLAHIDIAEKSNESHVALGRDPENDIVRPTTPPPPSSSAPLLGYLERNQGRPDALRRSVPAW